MRYPGVMALLRPLLLDNVPSIQQSAALALGRLANYSDELAEAVVSNEILPQLVYSLSEQNVSPTFKFILAPAFLQEGSSLRPPIRCQTFASPCEGSGELWRSRCAGQLPGRV